MIRFVTLTLIQVSMLFSQTQLAVVDFEALGVSNTDAQALTNRLIIELHRTNEFKVLEREMLDKIIEEQKFQLSGCNANQCLVELGQIANVQQIVGGTISKVGEVFTITARLIDVESGELVESALYDYEGKIGALMKAGMANIASQLAHTIIPDNSESTVGLKTSNGVVKVRVKPKQREPIYVKLNSSKEIVDDGDADKPLITNHKQTLPEKFYVKGSISAQLSSSITNLASKNGYSRQMLNNYLESQYGESLNNLSYEQGLEVLRTFYSMQSQD